MAVTSGSMSAATPGAGSIITAYIQTYIYQNLKNEGLRVLYGSGCQEDSPY